MAGSVKYDILVRHTADLQLAVKSNLTPLGSQLVTAQIITPEQYEVIRNATRSLTDRAADLVAYVQTKVHQDPRQFDDFLGVLKSDLSQYGGILTKLEQARLPQASEQQPAIPQPPPPRVDNNQLPAQGIFLCVCLGYGNKHCIFPSTSSSLAQPITLSTFTCTSWDTPQLD